MKWSIGAKIGGGFALALTLLVIIGVGSYRSTTRFMADAERVTHSHEILQQLEVSFSLLKDTQRGERGYVISGQERFLEEYNAALGRIDQESKHIRDLTADSPNQQRRLDAMEPLILGELAVLKKAIDLRKEKGLEAAVQVVRAGNEKTAMDDIQRLISEMENEENALLKQRSDEAKVSARNSTFIMIFGTLSSFVLLTAAGFFITGNISRPLREISGASQKIVSGDLTVKLPSSNRADEVGTLAQAFRKMVESLRGAVQEIQEGVNVLGSSASEILAVTTQVASGAAETGTAVGETTATVEEIKQGAQLSNQKAKYVSESAQKVAQVSQSGKKSAEQSVEVMNQIREQMESIAATILRLSEQSQAIGEIIAAVNDLADQTNLLAVNAAIEAAKAGEQGKGFAVVAQEVKSLAEQSKQATTQVRTILGDIQKATSAAVMATEQGSKAVEVGVKQAAQAGESVQKLAESIAEASQAATQIASSSQQQLVGMDQVASAMENIKQASAQNVAGTKQAETAAQNLHELGQKLKQVVEQYKV